MRRISRITRIVSLVLAVLVVPAGLAGTAAAAQQATTFVNWSAYLLGPSHHSANRAATAITPARVAGLTRVWRWFPAKPTMAGQPGPALFASPTVVNGRIYIGANTGVFYALDEATGHVIWQRFLGFVKQTTCAAMGFTSTATVAPDPVSGALTVYVAAANGYLYALNAANGVTKWRSVVGLPSATVNDYYNWSSPTVVNNRVYIGVSSECDAPLIAGGLKEYSQATGAQLAFYKTNPGGSFGPSIWSSAAAAGTAVYVTTGNGPSGSDSVSVERLSATSLAKLDAWQVPANQHGSDSDFGGSPTLFSATLAGTTTPLVGACNKNGTYYTLRRASLAAGPVWQFKAGAAENVGSPGQCDAAAVWDGANLYVSGNHTVIKGIAYAGSIRELNPATGAVRWQRGLPGAVIGSPTLNGSGVLAVPTYASSGLFLVNAANGAILRNIAIGPEFGQPVFADNMLLVPTQNNGLWAYR